MGSSETANHGVLVIAEIGVNHNGDVHAAKELVKVGHLAGANVAKFQVFRATSLATRSAPSAEYQQRNIGDDVSQYAMLEQLELSTQEFEDVVNYCEETGIEFMASGFSLDDIETIVGLGAKRLKIPSGEITNLPYLRAIAGHNLPTIMSTGMATLDEVGGAVDALLAAGLDRHHLTLLHCTTDYPTTAGDVHLRVIPVLQEKFGVPVGYSDHTEGIAIAVAAVALGSTVIEKHLTLDRQLPGPDHRASLEPGEFSRMVTHIRIVEAGLGHSDKRPTANEEKIRLVARKSIVAKTAISAGDVFTEENLTTKRPGNGLSPMLWDEMCGRQATRDYKPDDLIEQ
jgi:N,N'-diacetyllegionaminate synthase